VLKGALLLAVYLPDEHRSTRDGDLLLFGRYTRQSLLGMLQSICGFKQDDGLTFRPGKIELRNAGTPKCPVFAVIVPAMLGASNCDVHLHIHLDTNLGEAVVLSPSYVAFPSLLKLPRPKLKAYPIETVVAETLQAIAHLGLSNPRLKDYNELVEVALSCRLSGEAVRQAIAATFERNGVPVPTETPLGISAACYDAKARQTEWKALVRRHGLSKGLGLKEACELIEALAMPPSLAAAAGQSFRFSWDKGGWADTPSESRRSGDVNSDTAD
jgi:hypothetical protein